MMDDFEFIQPLSTHPRFTVFGAYARKLGFQVVLKQCAFKTIAEAEFFVRSALIKTRDRVYSQPLLSIFASGEKQAFINFVWRRGEGLDAEVEKDQESQFPSGKNGLDTQKPVLTNPHTVKRARCLTLGKEVICKVFKEGQMLDMNNAFREALAQARCSHPNICDLIDFRMYQGKKHSHCAYIVMEWLEPDLDTEMRQRVSNHQPYEEIELMTILKDVTAGLQHAKSQGLAYNDIRPSSILRGPQGLKLANFGSTWLRGQHSATPTAIGTDIHSSPETWETMANPENLQRLFESDVFSLGMTMLHLAAMKLPKRTMGHGKLQALLQRKVRTLRYSEELKRLLTGMLNFAPGERLPLEAVQTDAECIYRQATQALAQKAFQLRLQVRTIIAEKKREEERMSLMYSVRTCLEFDFLIRSGAKELKMYAAAHAILSRLPDDKDTAENLREWGDLLYNTGRKEEALEKYAAAHAILSRLPEDKGTAYGLREWGNLLYNTGREAEAVEKYAAAHDILSRLPEDKDTAENLRKWGRVLKCMEGREAEAVEKFEAAHDILSRLPEDKDTADNLRDWGRVLNKVGRRKEALEKHAAAHAILSRLSEDNDTSNNLREWGRVLECMEGREAEAVEKLEAARAIFVLCQQNHNASNCDGAVHSICRSALHFQRL